MTSSAKNRNVLFHFLQILDIRDLVAVLHALFRSWLTVDLVFFKFFLAFLQIIFDQIIILKPLHFLFLRRSRDQDETDK